MILLALAGWLAAIVLVAAVVWQRRELRHAWDRARLMEGEAGFWKDLYEQRFAKRVRGVASERREGPLRYATIEQLTRARLGAPWNRAP